MILKTISNNPKGKASSFDVVQVVHKGTKEQFNRNQGRLVKSKTSGLWVWVHHTGRESMGVFDGWRQALQGFKNYLSEIK